MFHLERKVTELDVDNAKLTEIFLANSGFENSLSSPSPWTYSVQGNPVQSGSVGVGRVREQRQVLQVHLRFGAER